MRVMRVRMCLRQASLNAVDVNGNTALHFAARNGYKQVAGALCGLMNACFSGLL